jgi:cytidine deaminase
MPDFFMPVTRRSALATLGVAGLGLFAMQSSQSEDVKGDALSAALARFEDKSRSHLRRLLQEPGFSGQISASDVAALVDSEHTSVDALMLDLLPLARTYSRPPISHYLVGAVARGVSGSLYLGANIEIPGHSLGFSVHGEQFALSNAYMHAEKGITAIAVTAAPCGHCRQFMTEIAPKRDIQELNAGQSPVRLDLLLPMAFTPNDLGFKEGALSVRETNLARPEGITDDLILSALDAARKSYAPYSKSHSGIAIATQSGRIHKGAYIENVAFNPSLSPLQTALAALIVAGEDYKSIARIALVETEGAAISQKSVTEAALQAIAQTAQLRFVTTRVSG